MTDPLLGLCPRPLHLMTEQELRNQVMEFQQLRTSHQTFKAKMESHRPTEKRSQEVLSEFEVEPKAKSKKVIDEFVL